jgi:thiamine kinase-like enzyme
VLIDGDNLKFIDFEYSGWDDPAKTICDFFLQPKVPVSTEFFGLVSTSFAESSKYPEKCLTRVKNVMPLCQAKWVLILLNGFSKVGRTRRNFSSAHHISALENQLIKAKELLNKIEV